MRIEVSYYGFNPCPICWPRRVRRTGEVLELKPGWVRMRLDGMEDGDHMSFDLTPGMTIKVLPEVSK